jgi:ADP-ribose pyrophosphatase
MNEWKRVEPTEVTKVGWRTVVTKTFELPDGSVHDFQLFNAEGSHHAGVVALTTDKKVIVARQFRPGPEKMMDEIPGGNVEAGEADYQAAAMRELQEETGYVSDKVTYLGPVYKDAYNNSAWHFYLAKDCVPSDAGVDPDEREFIDVDLISIEQFIENARTGKMTDTEAVFLAYDSLVEIMEGQND